MKNNFKKAPVKFWEDLLYFQHFIQILDFAPTTLRVGKYKLIWKQAVNQAVAGVVLSGDLFCHFPNGGLGSN